MRLSGVLRGALFSPLLLTASVLGAQGRPDYLASAREQMRQGRRDSAAVLLRFVTDSLAEEPTPRQVEAWVLTGVLAFYGGDDSAVVTAFRRAFALDPGVQATGLATIDSSLGATFEALRPKVAAAQPVQSSAPPALPPVGADSVYDCLKRCPAGVTKPVLLRFPQINPADAPPSGSQIYPGAGGMGPSGLHGLIEYHFIVNQAGAVEPGSVVVAMSTAGRWQPVFLQGLLQASFRPADLGPNPVRARVRLRVDISREGESGFRYQFAGP